MLQVQGNAFCRGFPPSAAMEGEGHPAEGEISQACIAFRVWLKLLYLSGFSSPFVMITSRGPWNQSAWKLGSPSILGQVCLLPDRGNKCIYLLCRAWTTASKAFESCLWATYRLPKKVVYLWQRKWSCHPALCWNPLYSSRQNLQISTKGLLPGKSGIDFRLRRADDCPEALHDLLDAEADWTWLEVIWPGLKARFLWANEEVYGWLGLACFVYRRSHKIEGGSHKGAKTKGKEQGNNLSIAFFGKPSSNQDLLYKCMPTLTAEVINLHYATDISEQWFRVVA